MEIMGPQAPQHGISKETTLEVDGDYDLVGLRP